MKSTINSKIGPVMEGHRGIRTEIKEMKEILHSVYGALETLRNYGMTNVIGLKRKKRCDDILQNFNICFNEMVIRKVFEGVIINSMSK